MQLGIALGGNLGDRLKNLRWGRACLSELFPGAPVRSGGLYETEPIGCPPGSPAFYNSVIEMDIPEETDLENLLAAMLALESRAERVRTDIPNSPRPLDLDMLYAGSHSWTSRTLTLPHPRMHLRRFVLRPLADLRPDLILPRQSGSISELLAALPSEEPEPLLVLRDW